MTQHSPNLVCCHPLFIQLTEASSVVIGLFCSAAAELDQFIDIFIYIITGVSIVVQADNEHSFGLPDINAH